MLIFVVYNPNQDLGVVIFIGINYNGYSNDTVRISNSSFLLSDLSLLFDTSESKLLSNFILAKFTGKPL